MALGPQWGAGGDQLHTAQARSSLWLRALPTLGIAPGAHVVAVAMSREPVLAALHAAGTTVTACDWHWAALAQAVAAGLPRACALPWDGKGPPVAEGGADVALVDLAHLAGRGAFALAVACAAGALGPGGRLLVCAGNADGRGGAARRLGEWFHPPAVVAYGGGRRILEVTPSPGAPLPWPPPQPPVAVTVAGIPLRLHPVEGVFARGLPEAGTAHLMSAVAAAGAAAAACSACDVGCGGGAAGLCLLGLGAAACTFVDESLLALGAVSRNLALAGWGALGCVLPADAALEVPGGPYDLVVCNPPFHDGPATSAALGREVVRGAAAATAPGGRLYLVSHRFLRYEEGLPGCREVAGDRTFVVLEAVLGRDGAPGRRSRRRLAPRQA